MLRNYVNPKSVSKSNIRSCLYSLCLQRGSASGGREEGRAPSAAEEFTRQGVASQTVEKAYDGAAAAAEAEISDDDSETKMEKVKEAFLKTEKGKDYQKKGIKDDDDDGLPINTVKGT